MHLNLTVLILFNSFSKNSIHSNAVPKVCCFAMTSHWLTKGKNSMVESTLAIWILIIYFFLDVSAPSFSCLVETRDTVFYYVGEIQYITSHCHPVETVGSVSLLRATFWTVSVGHLGLCSSFLKHSHEAERVSAECSQPGFIHYFFQSILQVIYCRNNLFYFLVKRMKWIKQMNQWLSGFLSQSETLVLHRHFFFTTQFILVLL